MMSKSEILKIQGVSEVGLVSSVHVQVFNSNHKQSDRTTYKCLTITTVTNKGYV